MKRFQFSETVANYCVHRVKYAETAFEPAIRKFAGGKSGKYANWHLNNDLIKFPLLNTWKRRLSIYTSARRKILLSKRFPYLLTYKTL